MEKIGTKAIRESLAGVNPEFRVIATLPGKAAFGILGSCNHTNKFRGLNLLEFSNRTLSVKDLAQFMEPDGLNLENEAVQARLWHPEKNKILRRFTISQIIINASLGNVHLMLQEI